MNYNSGKQLSFTYNAFNLPQSVEKNGAKMQFLYNAAGQKLRSTLFDSPANVNGEWKMENYQFTTVNCQLSIKSLPLQQQRTTQRVRH